MVNFTLEQLADFSRLEKKLIEELMGSEENNSLLSPQISSVNRVLDYSKSTSVRSSKKIGNQAFFLN